MNYTVFAFLGWPETVAILVVVLVLFGAKKLPELAKGLGQGIKEFKKATHDVQEDFHRAIQEEPAPPPRPAASPRQAASTEPAPAPPSNLQP